MYEVEIRKGGMFEDDITICAKEVDVTNPFFVYISGIQKPYHSTSIELPADATYEKFSKYENIRLPQHQIGFIGKIREESKVVLAMATPTQLSPEV